MVGIWTCSSTFNTSKIPFILDLYETCEWTGRKYIFNPHPFTKRLERKKITYFNTNNLLVVSYNTNIERKVIFRCFTSIPPPHDSVNREKKEKEKVNTMYKSWNWRMNTIEGEKYRESSRALLRGFLWHKKGEKTQVGEKESCKNGLLHVSHTSLRIAKLL